MVDLPEDSKGKNMYICRGEERIWMKIVDRFDFVDAYLITSKRKSPL